jgi:peptidyl-prolyl cis-trans isomerase D
VNFTISETSYAAEAGGQKIPLELARNAWLREQEQQHLPGELPPELKARLQDQILEGLIRDALMSARTEGLGYRVPDQDLRDAVRSEPAFQFNGQYSPEIARAALAQAGLSLEKYQDDLRSELQRQQLESGIRDSDFLTAGELQRARELQYQEREVRFAVLPPEKFQPTTPPDDAAVQAYYKAHQPEFMTPEWAHLQYGELTLAQVAAQFPISDADLHAAYDKQKAQFEQPERRHAHHILISVDKGDAAAKKLAEDVLAQAKAGKDFGALAKQYSQDPGSAQNGGDLGWADRSSYVGPFADALFAMSPGEIRGPVKTEFGYHIIRLDEVQAGKTKSFEEARTQLESDLRKGRATDRFGDIQEQLQSRLEQPNASLDALAKEFKLQTGEVAQFQRGTGGAPLGALPELQDLVFGDAALAVGRLGGPVLEGREGDERLVIVKVLDRHKAQEKPLAEVRESIVTALNKQRATDAALKAAEAAKVKLQGGASFDDVVHGLNVNADPARFIERNDPSMLPEMRQAVFDAPKPTDKPVYQTIKLASGGAALVQITKVRTQPEPGKEQQAARTEQAAARDGTADAIAYIEQLRRTEDVRKNPKAFE